MQRYRLLVLGCALFTLGLSFQSCQKDFELEVSPLEKMAMDQVVVDYFQASQVRIEASQGADLRAIMDFITENQETDFCQPLPKVLQSIRGAEAYATAACFDRLASIALFEKYPAVKAYSPAEWKELRQKYVEMQNLQASDKAFKSRLLANRLKK